MVAGPSSTMRSRGGNRVRSDVVSGAQVVFLHVPKAGGTGVEAELEEWFGRFPQKDRYRWWASPIELHRPGRIVGHFTYEMLAALAASDAAWLTIIRDPVERSISHWWHYTRNPDDAPWPEVFRAGVSLERWCTDPLFSCDASDTQTRYLAWLPEADRAAILDQRPVGPVPDDAVTLALDRLKNFAWVGVTERHYEGIQLLAYILRQTPPTRRPPVNEGQGRPLLSEISPEILEMLSERNRGDEQLHRRAQRLFADRYRDMVDDLLGGHVQAPAPSSFELDLSRPLADPAWHGLEQAGEQRFRWTSGNAAFDALIDRSVPREVIVEIVGWVDERAVERATLAVDGVTVPTERLDEGSVRLRARAEARAAWWVQRTRIDIQPGTVARAPGDPRPLGLAVGGVRIG